MAVSGVTPNPQPGDGGHIPGPYNILGPTPASYNGFGCAAGTAAGALGGAAAGASLAGPWGAAGGTVIGGAGAYTNLPTCAGPDVIGQGWNSYDNPDGTSTTTSTDDGVQTTTQISN